MRKLGLGLGAALLLVVLMAAWSVRSAIQTAGTEPVSSSVPSLSEGPDSTVGEASPSPTVEPPATTPAPPGLPTLPRTSDPDEYATAVAVAVFAHDTAAADPQDYRALLMAEADPQMTSRGMADLERMVAERIPTPEQWQRMRANDQWSQWQTEDVWQPGAWDEVVTSGQAEPGWAVRNVLGVQTTHFLDEGQERSTSRERTVTIGMRCPASGALVDRCRLTMVGIGVVS